MTNLNNKRNITAFLTACYSVNHKLVREYSDGGVCIPKLEGTHRVRSHDWLHHLANVNVNRGSSMRNGLIGPVTLTVDL